MSVSDDARARGVSEARFNSAAHPTLSVLERRTQLAYLISGAVIIALIFFYLQYSTKAICCGDFDGYYHFRWARMLWENFRSGQSLPAFNSLPLTTLNPRDYVDHHFLFHVAQIPFTWISADQHVGAKISAWFYGSLGVFACYWLIVRYRLRFTLLWLLALLASSSAFLYRMNMTKAMSFSLALLIVGLVLLFEGKHKWLGVLSFVFVWAYSLWFLLPIAVMIWACVLLWSERRIAWQPVVACAAGSVAGLIVNPYFPKNIKLFYEHARMKIAPSGFPTQVGGEWYAYDTRQFIALCMVGCVAMFVGYVAFNFRDRRLSARPLFFLVFSTMLMLMTAYSKRFIEYFPPFAILFAAFTLQTLFAKRESEIATLPRDVLDELQPFLDHDTTTPTDEHATTDERWRDDEVTVFGATVALIAAAATNLSLNTSVEFGIAALVLAAGFIGYYFLRGHRLLPAFVVAVAIGFALFFSVRQAAADIAERDANSIFRASPERFHEAMNWVKTNVPKGELIFNTNWDHFPKLFFESSDHAYVSGLDPNYLLDANRELSETYDNIRSGREENAAGLIRERFKARYIFTDQKKRGEDFFFNIMRSGWVEEVYDDDYATILRIRDERGEVPSEYIDGDDTRGENGENTEANNETEGDSGGDDEAAGDATIDAAPSSDEER